MSPRSTNAHLREVTESPYTKIIVAAIIGVLVQILSANVRDLTDEVKTMRGEIQASQIDKAELVARVTAGEKRGQDKAADITALRAQLSQTHDEVLLLKARMESVEQLQHRR